MTDSGLPILDLWPSWELDLRARNRSTATIRNYRLHLHTFADHLTESGHSGAADEIERRHVEAFIADQRPQEWGPGPHGIATTPHESRTGGDHRPDQDRRGEPFYELPTFVARTECLDGVQVDRHRGGPFAGLAGWGFVDDSG